MTREWDKESLGDWMRRQQNPPQFVPPKEKAPAGQGEGNITDREEDRND